MTRKNKHKLSIEELLVVKAVSLGYQIANGKVFESAINLINSSLQKKSVSPEIEAFYLMIRSEAHRFRQSNAYTNDRQQIKVLAERSRLQNVFELFTRVVEGTTGLYRVSGGGALSTVDRGKPSLGTEVMVDPDTSFVTLHSRNDDVNIILECAGISIGNISSADRSFLYDINLSVMIKKHFE